MKKLTISFLGRDCPGIVSAVSQILGQTGCNIIEVTQTILCGEFAAIFIVQAPENVTEESLHTQLALGLVDAKLDARPWKAAGKTPWSASPSWSRWTAPTVPASSPP